MGESGMFRTCEHAFTMTEYIMLRRTQNATWTINDLKVYREQPTYGPPGGPKPCVCLEVFVILRLQQSVAC